MNKLIIWIVLFMMLISPVSADLIHYWNMNVASDPLGDFGDDNSTHGIVMDNVVGSPTLQDGIPTNSDGSIFFDGNDGYITTLQGGVNYLGANWEGSIAVWFNTTDVGSNHWIAMFGGQDMFWITGSNLRSSFVSNDQGWEHLDTSVSTNTKYLAVLVFNGSGNTQILCNGGSCAVKNTATGTYWKASNYGAGGDSTNAIGIRFNQGYPANGNVDMVGMFNESFSMEQIEELYDSGDGIDYRTWQDGGGVTIINNVVNDVFIKDGNVFIGTSGGLSWINGSNHSIIINDDNISNVLDVSIDNLNDHYFLNKTNLYRNVNIPNGSKSYENVSSVVNATCLLVSDYNIFVGAETKVCLFNKTNFTKYWEYNNSIIVSDSVNVSSLGYDVNNNYLFIGVRNDSLVKGGITKINVSNHELLNNWTVHNTEENLSSYDIGSLYYLENLLIGYFMKGVDSFDPEPPLIPYLGFDLINLSLYSLSEYNSQFVDLGDYSTYVGEGSLSYECSSNISVVLTNVVGDNLNLTDPFGTVSTMFNISCNVTDGTLFNASSFVGNVTNRFDLLDVSLINHTKFYFNPNETYFNWTTLTLTQYNISAENQTMYGGLFNFSFLPNSSGSVWMNLTYTSGDSGTYPVYCGKGTDRNGAVLIDGLINITTTVNESFVVSCWNDYVNATSSFSYEYTLNFSEEI